MGIRRNAVLFGLMLLFLSIFTSVYSSMYIVHAQTTTLTDCSIYIGDPPPGVTCAPTAPNDSYPKDKERRLLMGLYDCLVGGDDDNAVIDIKKDEYKTYEDWVGKKADDGTHALGIDIPTNNRDGVYSCVSIFQDSVGPAFGDTISGTEDSEIGKWIQTKLTGVDNLNGDPIQNNENAWKAKITAMRLEVKAKYESIGAPGEAVLQQRFLPLANVCYTHERNNSKASFADPGDAKNFSVPNVGYFHLKTDDEIRSWIDSVGDFNKNNGVLSGGNVKFSQMELNWKWRGDDWDSIENDFYNFGTDTTYTLDHQHNAFLDCSDVFKNRALIFKGLTIDDDGQFIDGNGNIVTPDIDGGGNNVPGGPSCNTSWTNPITWIICPVLDLAAQGADALDTALHEVLETNKNQFDETQEDSSGAKLFESWSVFRNIAWLVLVIILLIAIISQAIGVGIFDAYTIKKVLPRVVVAVILVSLSWYLCKLIIEISNDIGKGVQGIIYSPFGGEEEVERVSLDLTGLVNGSISTLGAAGATIAVIAIGGPGILLVTILMALAAAFIGYIVIIARNIAIIALVIASPIALIFWILPNTKKYADFWWDAFSKALLMYPLILGIIALGKVFGYITLRGDENGTNSISNIGLLIVGLIAYYGPYFVIPKTFSLAGGLVARIAGVANDRSRGLFDRGKKYRQESMAKNWSDFKSGDRYKGNRGVGKYINAGGERFGLGARNGFGFTGRGKKALEARRRIAASEAGKTPEAQSIMYDDDTQRARTYENEASARAGMLRRVDRKVELFRSSLEASGVTGTELNRRVAAEKTRLTQKVEDSINSVKATTGFGQAQQQSAAQQMMANKTAFDDIEDVVGTIERVSTTGAEKSSMAANLKAMASAVGRNDLAGLDATTGGFAGGSVESALDEGYSSMNSYEMANMHRSGAKNLADHFQKKYRDAMQKYIDTGDTSELIKAKRMQIELRDAARTAKGYNRDAFLGALEGVTDVDARFDSTESIGDEAVRQTILRAAASEARTSRSDLDPNILSQSSPPPTAGPTS